MWTAPQGYIGYGWQDCDHWAHGALGGPHRSRDYWEPLFDLDVGEPLGLCT